MGNPSSKCTYHWTERIPHGHSSLVSSLVLPQSIINTKTIPYRAMRTRRAEKHWDPISPRWGHSRLMKGHDRVRFPHKSREPTRLLERLQSSLFVVESVACILPWVSPPCGKQHRPYVQQSRFSRRLLLTLRRRVCMMRRFCILRALAGTSSVGVIMSAQTFV